MKGPSDALTFIPVQTDAAIATVAELAVPIWQECFTPIIGAEQVAYMLDAWQSPHAIRCQMAEGARYVLVQRKHTPIGFYALHITAPGSCKLSKLYLLRTMRHRGYGCAMLQEAMRQARAQQCKTLWLQVNRHNTQAILFYQKAGFQTMREQRQDIGQGFTIDDFIMECPL